MRPAPLAFKAHSGWHRVRRRSRSSPCSGSRPRRGRARPRSLPKTPGTLGPQPEPARASPTSFSSSSPLQRGPLANYGGQTIVGQGELQQVMHGPSGQQILLQAASADRPSNSPRPAVAARARINRSSFFRIGSPLGSRALWHEAGLPGAADGAALRSGPRANLEASSRARRHGSRQSRDDGRRQGQNENEELLHRDLRVRSRRPGRRRAGSCSSRRNRSERLDRRSACIRWRRREPSRRRRSPPRERRRVASASS